MKRRRFLAVMACAALTGFTVRPRPPARWRGVAFGAEVSITLVGAEPGEAEAALAAAREEIARIETLFSLYRTDSVITRLNRDGVLRDPPADLVGLLQDARATADATDGFFDPTVQPLWRGLAAGEDARETELRRSVDWRRLAVDPQKVRLARRGMAVTVNGIAQGWAADRVAALLRARGFTSALVNLGEFAALGRRDSGGPWRLGIADPESGSIVARLDVENSAAATSEPGATRIGRRGASHILDPVGAPGPRWRSVTAVAETAALADAVSTAVAAAPMGLAEELLRKGGAQRAVLIGADGRLKTLTL